MLVTDAQRESRQVFLGGSVGQFVSALVWLTSSAVTHWVGSTPGFWTLALGGALIFPLTQGVLRLLGRSVSLSKENPLGFLAMEVAFTVPLVLPLAGLAAQIRPGYFYPACLIIVGAHYLPFVFLYGDRTFAVLGGLMLALGYGAGVYRPAQVELGGWLGGLLLLVASVVLLATNRREFRTG